MNVTVKVLGGADLVAALARVGVKGRQIAVQHVQRASLAIERDAKSRCPVDTGRLRSSIHPTFKQNGLGAEIITDVVYAPFVEFGTVRSAAQPFMFPAAEQNREAFVKGLEAELRQIGRP